VEEIAGDTVADGRSGAGGGLPAPEAARLTPKTLWRSWIVYALSSVAGRLVGFLMLPIYTRVLSPEEYGIRAMVVVGVELVAMVCWVGLTTAMTRFYTGDGSGERRVEAISTAYATGTVLWAAGAALAMLGAPWLAILVLGDAAHAGLLRLGLISMFFTHTMEIGMAYLRLRQRAGTVAVVSLITLVLTLTTNIVFVVILRWGVAGILYGEILTFGIFSVIIARLTLREVGLRVSLPLARRMIAYGAPLTLMPAATLLVDRSAGVFLTHYDSLAAAGIYALAIQCAQVLLLAVIGPFRAAWDPGQFEIARDPHGAETYRRVFQIFTFALVMAAFAFAMTAEDVIRLLAAPQFYSAAAVVPILLAAHVATGLTLFFESGFLVKNRTGLLAAVSLVGACISLAANALLVPRFSAAGAAHARLLSLLAMAALSYAIAQRLWPQRPDFVALGKVIALAVAAFALSELAPREPLVLSLACKAVLFVAVVGFSVVVGAIDRHDLVRVTALLRGRIAARRRRAVPDAAR
jgi:O-antigen/teichoic acid export membrane protein